MSINDNPEPRTARQAMLDQVFGHDCTERDLFASVSFPGDLKGHFRALIEEGKSIAELEIEVLGQPDKPKSSTSLLSNLIALNLPHYKPFSRGIQALMGDKAHYQKAIGYALANHNDYLKMTDGFFCMPSLDIDHLPPVSELGHLPNYCRNEDGQLRSYQELRTLIHLREDSYVLVLSAIANLDSEAVKALSECMPRHVVFGILRNQMKQCSDATLEAAFGHFFHQRTHVTFMAEMKRLMESTFSTCDDFEQAFWPEASKFSIDKMVADALKQTYSKLPQMVAMLQVFRRRGIDLHPGLVLCEKEEADYFDVLDKLPDLAERQRFIMDVIAKRSKVEDWADREEDLSVLLLDIPLEVLTQHPEADLLLQHLFEGTGDKSIFKLIGDKKYKGRALEMALGL
jgi:hypothetical protein